LDADYSVELGADDDALEFPWESAATNHRYYDLKRQPELLLYIEEVREFPELGGFLATVNAKSRFLTAKCDIWTESELSEAEQIYGASLKQAAYVDLVFEAEAPRYSFEEHEKLAGRLSTLLSKAPELAAAIELIIRRCYYREAAASAEPGFYITAYVFGYGDDTAGARQNWGIGVNLLRNALLQVAGEYGGGRTEVSG